MKKIIVALVLSLALIITLASAVADIRQVTYEVVGTYPIVRENGIPYTKDADLEIYTDSNGRFSIYIHRDGHLEEWRVDPGQLECGVLNDKEPFIELLKVTSYDVDGSLYDPESEYTWECYAVRIYSTKFYEFGPSRLKCHQTEDEPCFKLIK